MTSERRLLEGLNSKGQEEQVGVLCLKKLVNIVLKTTAGGQLRRGWVKGLDSDLRRLRLSLHPQHHRRGLIKDTDQQTRGQDHPKGRRGQEAALGLRNGRPRRGQRQDEGPAQPRDQGREVSEVDDVTETGP